MKSTTYTSAELNEREAFIQIKHIFEEKLKDGEKLTYYTSPICSKDNFDVYMIKWNCHGKRISHSIIEIKVRNDHYSTLLLEKQKYNSLHRLRKKDLENCENINIFYICFTPKSTYLFDLTDENQKYNWIKKEFVKSTIDKEKGTKIKEVTFLNVDDSVDLDHIYFVGQKTNELKDELDEQKRKRCIFYHVDKLNS